MKELDPVLHVLLQAHKSRGFMDRRRVFLRVSINGGTQRDFYAEKITGLNGKTEMLQS